MPLLANEPIAIALKTIDFHQFQAQIAALRFELERFFQQISRLVQMTTLDMQLSLTQYIGRTFSDGSRRRGRRQLYIGSRHLQALETPLWHIHVGGEIGFFRQCPSHALMLLGFLLGLSTTDQQQQEQQGHQHHGTGDQPHHDRAGQQVVELALFGRRRLDCRLDRLGRDALPISGSIGLAASAGAGVGVAATEAGLATSSADTAG